ncbi:MAG: bifunctional 4-hydroxy-3-methylbut-2-enyl diphosphate reductase/30S ribosomal protein S1, partial [Clostridia bacterium]|nr:bifunctional 4-hydroxy-3-methylbut-2-enyl diphosphate reductase/30S ribosomal protein S1 [Clostridia bacterium]
MNPNAKPAKLIVAKTAGFCFGVSRAIDLTRRHASGAYALGHVIHNESVVAELESMGMHTVSSAAEIPDGTTAIIRAHGECRRVYDELTAKNVTIVDTTCPCVRKIHEIVAAENSEGRAVIIIGQRGHPEAVAISDRADDVVILSS